MPPGTLPRKYWAENASGFRQFVIPVGLLIERTAADSRPAAAVPLETDTTYNASSVTRTFDPNFPPRSADHRIRPSLTFTASMPPLVRGMKIVSRSDAMGPSTGAADAVSQHLFIEIGPPSEADDPCGHIAAGGRQKHTRAISNPVKYVDWRYDLIRYVSGAASGGKGKLLKLEILA